MKAIIGCCAMALLLGSWGQAATINTTLTVSATAALNSSDTAFTVSGSATLTNIGTGGSTLSGTISANVAITSLSGTNATIPFTMTFSSGTLSGSVILPVTILLGESTSATGSGTITGGSGSYAGDSATFPSLSGSGGVGASGITLTFTGAGTFSTSGGGTVAPTPTITAVQDAAANTPSIAEGSIFIVKGTNLSASGFNEFSLPYPTSSGGIQIAFTPASGGTATLAYLIYLYNQSGVNQLAAILPSSVAAGNYNVTVTNNSGTVTAPFPATVVQHKPSLFTQDSSGTGLVVLQNYVSASELDINRFTTGSVSGVTISPAKPGQTVIAWATGLGPITTPDNASSVFNFLPSLNVQVIVGGVSITPTFAGLSGYPGEDQINFVLPSSIPTGCTQSLQISVNGVLSNPTFLSIAPSSSATACVAPGLTTAQLQNLDNGGTLTGGGFDLEQFSANVSVTGMNVSENIAAVAGGFTQVTGFQLASSSTVTFQPGVCQVTQVSTTTVASPSPVVTSGGATGLDAGAITLTGPGGSNITKAALTETSDTYDLTIIDQISNEPSGVTLPGIPNASIVAGTYTLNGAGGKDVGPFSAAITLGTQLKVTGGLPTTVTRSSGLTLNWTGGNSTDLVEIFGSTQNASTYSSFACFTTAGAGTFTVPASILDQLQAVSASAISAGTGTGVLGVFSTPTPASGNGAFSAPLTAGGSITNATFLALLGIEGSATYQ